MVKSLLCGLLCAAAILLAGCSQPSPATEPSITHGTTIPKQTDEVVEGELDFSDLPGPEALPTVPETTPPETSATEATQQEASQSTQPKPDTSHQEATQPTQPEVPETTSPSSENTDLAPEATDPVTTEPAQESDGYHSQVVKP